MKDCYLFSFLKDEKPKNGLADTHRQNHLVIFFPYKETFKSKNNLEKQFREYFFRHTLPDKIFIICFDYNVDDIVDAFKKNSTIYDYIPKYDYEQNSFSISITSIGIAGKTTSKLGEKLTEENLDALYRRGLTGIFIKNGGLVTAQAAHHYEFPSGKHSDKFLRTGNVLLHGTEILFIASALVRFFKKEKVTSIYADTSSINSLVYAYINLLKDLNPEFKESVLVESFGSYSHFEQGVFHAKADTQFLISASTSGGILKRMLNPRNSGGKIAPENLVILYGLSVDSSYSTQVLCDIENDINLNPEGIEPFRSYKTSEELCEFCTEEGSIVLKVEGDVFLLDKPSVSSYTIAIKDNPNYLRNFSDFFRKPDEQKPIASLFKCYFKENPTPPLNRKYETFLDIDILLDEWGNKTVGGQPFNEIFLKLEKHILQCVPASTRYLIFLPDSASKKLAEIVLEVLKSYYLNTDHIKVIGSNSEALAAIKEDEKGTIAVISSTTVTGSNLLYLSRALRDYEPNYRRVFFTFISRTGNPGHAEFLQSNLGQGEFGKETHMFHRVETINCPDETKHTSWHEEENKIKEFQDFFENHNGYDAIEKYCDTRISELSYSGKEKGLSNNLFFPSFRNKPLKLRSGFAFSPFLKEPEHQNFIKHSTQAEVYFIISTIINDLRNRGKLVQGEYVRTVLDPGNFIRYNDGVIQAALLRSARREELDYSLNKDHDIRMRSVLGEMILHLDNDHAEALSEFFYAVAIKKMKLSQETLKDCVELLRSRDEFVEDSILGGLEKYITENVIEKTPIEKKFKTLAAEQVNMW